MDEANVKPDQIASTAPEPVTEGTTSKLSQAGARDILVFRGAEYWPTPEDVIREVHAQGLSVRIPRNQIPEGLVHGLSRIALGHIKAVMTVENAPLDAEGNPMTAEDAVRAAFEAATQFEGHDPEIDAILGRTYEHAPSRWLEMPESETKREIFEKLGVKFSPGIFAYSYYTGLTYYLKPEETEAPVELAAKGIHAVRGVVAETGEVIPVQDQSNVVCEDDDETDS
ncbi:hypothetical protein ANRL3_02138 [Anaerolineae bacterium]|nr:hypothetical protein ANRL3_02138 [Anaerolineae bacterium]